MLNKMLALSLYGYLVFICFDKANDFCSIFQVELLAAKNLIGANLNGTSDPYAIITCGLQKRFR